VWWWGISDFNNCFQQSKFLLYEYHSTGGGVAKLVAYLNINPKLGDLKVSGLLNIDAAKGWFSS
jgi:hypothetical protein